MGRLLIVVGLLSIALPFVVMGCEVAWAVMSGATGETRMAAGQWGVYVGFLSAPAGIVALLLGIVIEWLSR
jgi:hypothetical protein